MKTVGAVIGVVIAVLALTWIVQGNDFFMYKYFGPKYEQQRRDIFEKSKAYNQGMIQELQNMRFEYVKASPEQKDALASVILHRVADFDLNQPQVPDDLRQFIEQLRRERANAR